MDVEKLTAELNAEIEVTKAAIACLEQLRGSANAATNGSRRGKEINECLGMPAGFPANEKVLGQPEMPPALKKIKR